MAAGEKDVLQRSEEKQLSAASEEFEDESLDPRVQVELEKLNKASDDINKLELELDEARASFRQVLTESTQKLNALSKKLGSCIEKARCYYDARMKAKEAQIQTQNVALRFERACSQQMAAKEMVYLAEQGFFKKGQPFDPAWQEMLNHATMKVNEAERERLESEIAHQVTARIFNECEQRVKYLQKDLKRNIAKSRPYFEQKARFNQTMEEQKRLVGSLEQAVADSKMMYSEALRNLERISDEIHQQRKDAQLRKEMGTRGSGVGAEEPHPPPVDGERPPKKEIHAGHVTVNRTNSQTQTESDMLEEGSDRLEKPSNGDVHQEDSAEVIGKREGVSETEQSQVNHTSISQKETQCTESKEQIVKRAPVGAVPGVPQSLFKKPLPVHDRDRQHLTVEDTETVSETVSSTEMLTPGSGPSSIHTTAVTSPETEHEPEAHVESTKTNMEIMETLQKAKNFRSPFLRPNRSRDDLLDEGASDNESIPGSMASVSVLDDDQIESLMLETGDFVNFLATQDEHEAEKIKSMTLPAKLSYLSNYMSFKPEFTENNGTEVSTSKDSGSGDNDSTDYGAPSGRVGDLNDFPESGEPVQSKLIEPLAVINSKEYDACWSCDIDTEDIPEDVSVKLDDIQVKIAGSETDVHQGAPGVEKAAGDSQPAGDKPRCRRYSFEEDSEFQRVYKELSGFEKLMRSSSSEESPPPQSPLVLRPSDLVTANEESVKITVTAAEGSPECQKDPLGVMPMKGIACVGAISSRNVPNGKSSSSEKSVDNVEHFV